MEKNDFEGHKFWNITHIHMAFCRTKLGCQDQPQHWILLCIPRSKPLDPKMLLRSTPLQALKAGSEVTYESTDFTFLWSKSDNPQSWSWNLLITEAQILRLGMYQNL